MGHETLESQAGSQTVWLVRCDPVWLVRGARQVPTGAKHGRKSAVCMADTVEIYMRELAGETM
jgi:hypothetical protein